MDIREVQAYLGADWKALKVTLAESLNSDIDLLNRTNQALLANGGKQLRPMLSLLSARCCGGGGEDAVRVAAAAEMLHNATLLHDDVADNSPSRRGAPTVKSLLGDRASVLLGDFWLVRAVELILNTSSCKDEGIRIFAKTLADLAEGEMLQLEKAGSADTTEADYLRIIYNKTASLFEAAAVTGALSAKAPETYREAIRTYAVNLGLAFQIRDDMFDYTDGDGIGKPVGIDLKEQKITLPLLGALAAVPMEEASRIRERVRSIGQHPEEVEEIRAWVRKTGGMEYAARKLEEYVKRACAALETLPPSEARDWLDKLANYTAVRNV